MYKTMDDYLQALKEELKGSDPAVMQDALSDAQEHLFTALAAAHEAKPDVDEADALQLIVAEYGSPEETASAYKEVERRTLPSLKQPDQPRSALARFFGVYLDARTWGALLFMLIAFVTGIIYFTWVVTGLSLSISLSIFIFGLPLALLFLLSVRGLALLEGRLVEALLGVRMPRRPLFAKQGLKLLERLKLLVLDKHTWFAMIYMILQFLLGTIYFVVIVTAISVSLSFIAVPFVQSFLNYGVIVNGNVRYFLPLWSYPLLVLGGFLLLTVFLQIVRGVGQLHGRMAKAMLVSE